MMFELPHQNIMGKIIKLSGQPILCQLFSFIPDSVISDAVMAHKSDHYYKTMSTRKQLAFILYGVITRCHSLQSLCKSLLLLESKLLYIGIDKLPPVSTLSDANVNRNSDVFGDIYRHLYRYYKSYLSDSCFSLPLNGELDNANVKLFDATTITLFVDVFKGVGRNPINGKRKGGLKVQAQMPLSGFVPDLITITEGSCNDKNFLGQLNPSSGTIYVFDKGYVNFTVFNQWTNQGVYFVTRLNENAVYNIAESNTNDIEEYTSGGIIRDEIVQLKLSDSDQHLRARLITYKDPLTGNVLKFLTNMLGYQASTISLLYKNRWSMEVLFKRLKQNFELSYFYSDSPKGIKTQIWIVLIAHLLFTVIHKQIKECEQFTTLVSMASNNLGSYVCLISLLKRREKLSAIQRDIRLLHKEMNTQKIGGLFEPHEKSP
jgi:hypothetical protein